MYIFPEFLNFDITDTSAWVIFFLIVGCCSVQLWNILAAFVASTHYVQVVCLPIFVTVTLCPNLWKLNNIAAVENH